MICDYFFSSGKSPLAGSVGLVTPLDLPTVRDIECMLAAIAQDH